MSKTLNQLFLENLDVALFPIERPDFFLNVEEYFDIITKVYLQTNKEWLTQKRQHAEDILCSALLDELLEDLKK